MTTAVTPQTVHITDSTFPDLAPEQQALKRVGASVQGHQCKTEADTLDALRGAQVVITQFAPMTRRVLETLASPATIVRYGVGVDNIDLDAAHELGIAVANVPDYCLDEVADHTVAVFLSLWRKLPQLDQELRSGGWAGIAVAKPLLPLKKATVGLIGLGRIGRATLERLKPFGCRLVVHDPALTEAAAREIGAELLGMDDLLAQADAISLHLPLTPQTHHFLNAERLARLKRGVVILNSARGALIDSAALAEALHSGQVGAAGLDVFETEPLEADSPLRNAPNTLLTPHLSWYSEDAIGRLQTLAGEEAARAVAGEALRCRII